MVLHRIPFVRRSTQPSLALDIRCVLCSDWTLLYNFRLERRTNIWPSEEVLALYCLTARHRFEYEREIKRILCRSFVGFRTVRRALEDLEETETRQLRISTHWKEVFEPWRRTFPSESFSGWNEFSIFFGFPDRNVSRRISSFNQFSSDSSFYLSYFQQHHRRYEWSRLLDISCQLSWPSSYWPKIDLWAVFHRDVLCLRTLRKLNLGYLR